MQRSGLAQTPLRIFNWPNFPGWKGFFYEVEHQAVDKHTVAYLPTINKSPTKMDTIQEVLYQVKEKAEKLSIWKKQILS